MKYYSRLVIALCSVAAALFASPVLADTGSDWFNASVTQLQQQIKMRNQIADEIVSFQLARGYAVPEIVGQRTKTMFARADDDAFGNELRNLRHTLQLFALVDLDQ